MRYVGLQVTVVALLVSFLILVAPLSLFPDPLAVFLACVFIYFVPGLLIWDIFFRHLEMNLFEAAPYCFALSLTWLALVLGFVGVFLNIDLSATVLAIFVSTLILASMNLVVKLVWPRSRPSLFPRKDQRILVALTVFIAGLLTFLFYIGGSMDNDSWLLLSVAQEMLRLDTVDLTELSLGFSSSYAFPLTFMGVGLLAELASTDIITVWFYLPLFLVPMSILAVFGLAKALFKSDGTAFMSTVIFAASIYYFYQLSLFAHLPAPDSLNNYILLPLFLAASLRWAALKNWSPNWLLLLLAIGVSMAIIHNSQYFYAVAILIVGAVLHAIFWRSNWLFLLRLLVAGLILIALFVTGFEVAKHVLPSSSDASFMSIIENRNTLEVIKARYPFPITSQHSVFYTWILPLSLLMFLLALKPDQRIAATMVFTLLYTGSLVYFQPQLLEIALRTIPKLDRFFLQINLLATPLAWGWVLTTASTVIAALSTRPLKRLNAGNRKLNVVTNLLLLLPLLILAATVYWGYSDAANQLIFTIYPANYMAAIVTAAVLAWFSTLLARRQLHLLSGLDRETLPSYTRFLPAVVSLILLALLFSTAPDLPSWSIARANSTDPNDIVPANFGEEVAAWWEPELLAFLKHDLPAGSTVLTQCWPRYYLNPLVKHELIYDESLYVAFDPRLDLTTYVSALNHRQIDYVLLTNGPSSWASDCNDEQPDIMINNYNFLVPLLATCPQVFEKVYESPLNTVVKITRPAKDKNLSNRFWREYQAHLGQSDRIEALCALQLWALYSPNANARCQARDLAMPLVAGQAELSDPVQDGRGEDVATAQMGAGIVDSRGFSLRPDRALYTVIDGNRFNNPAVTYAEAGGLIPCGAWFVLDIGQPRNLSAVELEWDRTTVRDGRLEYWADDAWWPLLALDGGSAHYDLPTPISTSRVRLSLAAVNSPGGVGLRRISLYERPRQELGQDIALLSAGTTVEAFSSIWHPSLSIEEAIDGDDLENYGAVAGGPDESYPDWFVLNFNQIRIITALEIQWWERSYGQSWEVTYYDGDNWHELSREQDWTPPPNHLYRYVLPEPVQASKIRLQVNWTSGGRLAVRRFSVYQGGEERSMLEEGSSHQ